MAIAERELLEQQETPNTYGVDFRSLVFTLPKDNSEKMYPWEVKAFLEENCRLKPCATLFNKISSSLVFPEQVIKEEAHKYYLSRSARGHPGDQDSDYFHILNTKISDIFYDIYDEVRMARSKADSI